MNLKKKSRSCDKQVIEDKYNKFWETNTQKQRLVKIPITAAALCSLQRAKAKLSQHTNADQFQNVGTVTKSERLRI